MNCTGLRDEPHRPGTTWGVRPATGTPAALPPHWVNGFDFGAVLAFLATLVVYFLCKAPTLDQMKKAEAGAAAAAERGAAKRRERASRSAVT